MAQYASDEEQLEALKAWWRENARSVIAGVVLAAAGVGGWQAWQWHVDSQTQGASAVYSHIENELPMGDRTTIIERAETLRDDYAGTEYAALGALAAARASVRDGDLGAAAEWLAWVRDNADADSLRTLARTRHARVLAEEGEHERALELVAGDAPAGWVGVYAEIRGDILSAQGDYTAAADAYDAALDADERLSEARLVELKRNRAQVLAAGGAEEG